MCPRTERVSPSLKKALAVEFINNASPDYIGESHRYTDRGNWYESPASSHCSPPISTDRFEAIAASLANVTISKSLLDHQLYERQ